MNNAFTDQKVAEAAANVSQTAAEVSADAAAVAAKAEASAAKQEIADKVNSAKTNLTDKYNELKQQAATQTAGLADKMKHMAADALEATSKKAEEWASKLKE